MWLKSVKEEAELSIAQRSANALNSFKETIKSLEEINNEVDTIVASNEDTMLKLAKEISELTSVAKQNANIISNINKLIGG